MSWRRPAYLFGPTPSDRAMMEEVLQLLASDSPSQDRSSSTTASNTTDTNHYCSSASGMNHGSVSGTNHDEDDSGDSAEDTGGSNVVSSPSNDESLEEKYPAGHRTEQEQAPLGFVLQQNSISSSMMPRARPVPAPMQSTMQSTPPPYHQSSWSPQFSNAEMLGFFVGDLGFIAVAAAAGAPNLPPLATGIPTQVAVPLAIPSVSPTESTARRPQSPHKKPRASASVATSKVLPTGQRIYVMNSAEFDELRRKLRMQTASRRYRKRKKEEARQQKAQIQELQAKLFRLQELESQMKQYEQRPIESLETELKMHQDEVADLTGKVQDAAKEELDWLSLINQPDQRNEKPSPKVSKQGFYRNI